MRLLAVFAALALLLPLDAGAANILVVPADDTARKASDGVVDALTFMGLPVKVAGGRAVAVVCFTESDAQERRECLVDAGTRALASVVITITATEKKAVLSANLEVIAQANGRTLKQLFIKAPTAKWAQKAAPQLKALKALIVAQRLADQPTSAQEPKSVKKEPVAEQRPLREREPPAQTDRPSDVSLLPTESRPEARVEAGAARGPNVAALTVSGVAVVAAGAAVTFALVGAGTKGRLENTPDGLSAYSYPQALQLQATANTQLSVALGAAIAAGVSAGVAAILWGVER